MAVKAAKLADGRVVSWPVEFTEPRTYPMNTVIGTWSLCDCDEAECKRMPVACGPGRLPKRRRWKRP